MRRIRTKEEFRAARLELDLTGDQLGEIFCVAGRTIRRIEEGGEGGFSTASRFPLFCRILEWMLNTGFRPPEYKRRNSKSGRPIANKVTT